MRRPKSDFELTQSILHQMFNYDSEKGTLINKEGFRGRTAGVTAVQHMKRGTAPVVSIYGNSYQLGRIIWVYVYGYNPEERVRFINRDYSDIRLNNLCLQLKVKAELPTQAELREYLRYDPVTGSMIWGKLPTFGSRQKLGNTFGCYDKRNSRMVARFNNCQKQLTSFIWCYMTGNYPQKGFVIDHKNGNPLDNSWGNLREVTQQQNLGNINKNRKGTKCLRGVAKNYYGKFHMRLWYKGVKYGGPVRATAEEAHADYIELHKKLHSEFSNYSEKSK